MKLFIRLLVLGYGVLAFEDDVPYASERIYNVHIVKQIIVDPAGHQRGGFALDPRPHINTNSLPKGDRMDMCDKARNRVREETGIRIWYWKNGEPERQQYYGVYAIDGAKEVVLAYRCPCRPGIILQVLEGKNGKEIVNAIVRLSRDQIKIRNDDNNDDEDKVISVDKIEYRLIRAVSIHKATRTEVQLYYDSDEDADPDRITEGEFLQMCIKALETYPDEHITWMKDNAEDLEFYRFREINIREYDIVLAFRCPTMPRTLITVPRVNRRTARLILDAGGKDVAYVTRKLSRLEFQTDYMYELKVARLIEEVTSSSSRERKIPEDVIESAVNSSEMPAGECLRLCREGLGVVLKEYQYDYRFKTIKEPESEKYYTFNFENEEGESNDSVHLEAFKCPTKPELYIHISTQNDKRSLVWVIIQDRPAKFTLERVHKIYEASTRQVTRNIHELTAIDTDNLSENNRHRMCRKAIRLLDWGAEYYRGGETGLSKIYTIETSETEWDTAKDDYPMVRAFACPTEPRLYLEVELSTDSLRYSIRVLIKERYYPSEPALAPRINTSASKRFTRGDSSASLIRQMSAYRRSQSGQSADFEK